MFPLLLPFVLFMYGELSNCRDTRFISRVMLYTILGSWYVPSSLLDETLAVYTALFINFAGFTYCITLSRTWIGRGLFTAILFMMIINYGSLLLDDYYILNFGWYVTNSAFLLRESVLLAVTTCTKLSVKGEWDERESWLVYCTFMLYGLEWFLLRI